MVQAPIILVFLREMGNGQRRLPRRLWTSLSAVRWGIPMEKCCLKQVRMYRTTREFALWFIQTCHDIHAPSATHMYGCT